MTPALSPKHPRDQRVLRRLAGIARELGVPEAAMGEAGFPDLFPLAFQDVVVGHLLAAVVLGSLCVFPPADRYNAGTLPVLLIC